jgi:hypothetical protein
MTGLMERPAEMSVVTRNLTTEEEVSVMSATTVFQHQTDFQHLHEAPTASIQAARRARPHGIDRIVMRLSLAMLLWVRHRADRGTVSHEEHAMRHANEVALERDRHAAALRISRVF